MTIQAFLARATKKLQAAGVTSARLDCLILLEDVLGMDRAALLAHPETAIPIAQLAILNKNITRRSRHIPLAYIRGHAPFYGRDFLVNEHVLVPRPETEIMIEMLLKLPLPSPVKLGDIGTGSGCIGITAALELPGSQVDLYDIDTEALDVARRNIEQLHAAVTVHQIDLIDNKLSADVILANLPYVPQEYAINRAAQHEPRLAIFAGQDGLDLYGRFWSQLDALPRKPSFILTESLAEQHDKLATLAQGSGYQLHDSQGLIQVFKHLGLKSSH